MELRQIRVFLVLAEELHFSRTAARLHVAQSAVSHTIRSLEEELGAQLFVRSRRRVALSQAGERFRERASQALQGLEQAGELARRVGNGQSGRLVLRFTLMSALTLIPRAVAAFQRAYPEVEVELGPAGSTEQLDALRSGRCDIGFMPTKRDLEDLSVEMIQRAPLVAVLPAAHALAKRKQVKLAELAQERFVFLNSRSEPQTRGYFFANCRKAGFEPNVVLEFEQLEVLLALVAAGAGVSCTPDLVRTLRFPGVKTVPLSPTIRGGFCAVWDPRQLSAAGRNFLAVLRQERARCEAAGAKPARRASA